MTTPKASRIPAQGWPSAACPGYLDDGPDNPEGVAESRCAMGYTTPLGLLGGAGFSQGSGHSPTALGWYTKRRWRIQMALRHLARLWPTYREPTGVAPCSGHMSVLDTPEPDFCHNYFLIITYM